MGKTTPNEHSFNNNLVNIKVVIEVFRPMEYNSDLYFGLSGAFHQTAAFSLQNVATVINTPKTALAAQ